MEQEEDVLEIPYEVFDKNWNILQKFLEKRGNPPYKIIGDVNLRKYNIKDLGNLVSVSGDLDLSYSSVKDLGNLVSVSGDLDLYGSEIKSLGNLTYVGRDLYLRNCQIKSLGNLTYVGGYLGLQDSEIESLGNLTSVGELDFGNTPISKTMSKEEIRQIVNVEASIFF